MYLFIVEATPSLALYTDIQSGGIMLVVKNHLLSTSEGRGNEMVLPIATYVVTLPYKGMSMLLKFIDNFDQFASFRFEVTQKVIT